MTVPKYALPADCMDPDIACKITHDELMLDGNAGLNLATFVSTWMEPQTTGLMTRSASTRT